MLVVDLLGWWYSRGWSFATRQLMVERPTRTFNFFSIPDLLRTLMAPFRQDVVDTRRMPLGVKLQMFTWNLISRLFGLLIRSGLIIVGLLTVALQLLLAALGLVIWPLLPLVPLLAIGLILFGASL